MTAWHSLAGKKIWVFGGAGYLGSAITRALSRECRLTLCIDLLGKAEAWLAKEPLSGVVPVSLDVSRVERLDAFVEEATSAHGVPDGVVNLTYSSSAGKPLEALTTADFTRPFEESVTSFFALARALAERMKPRGYGSFVHFASMYGLVAPDPSVYEPPLVPNPIDYGASKAAILQMSRYLAVHYGAAGLRFNCVVPGPFPNPDVQSRQPGLVKKLAGKTPLGRIGGNAEVVGPTLFLLTDSASFVTGQALIVDGGWTAW